MDEGQAAYEARFEGIMGPRKAVPVWAELPVDTRAIWVRVHRAVLESANRIVFGREEIVTCEECKPNRCDCGNPLAPYHAIVNKVEVAGLSISGAVSIRPEGAASGVKFEALDIVDRPHNARPPPGATGFTGNVCTSCGSMAMVRTGHCETCQVCFSTSGCS